MQNVQWVNYDSCENYMIVVQARTALVGDLPIISEIVAKDRTELASA
jgi:hypothetical protein